MEVAVEVAAGPLGVELEPAERRGRYAVGCRVTGFRKFDGGILGQVEASGRVSPGSIVSAVDGEETVAMSFDKVMALLMRGVGKPQRRIEFTLPPQPPPQAAAADAAAAVTLELSAGQGGGTPISVPRKRNAARAAMAATAVTGKNALPQLDPPSSSLAAACEGSGGARGMQARPGSVILSPGHGRGKDAEVTVPLGPADSSVAAQNGMTGGAVALATPALEEALMKASAALAKASAPDTAAASESEGSDDEVVLFDVGRGVDRGFYGGSNALHSGSGSCSSDDEDRKKSSSGGSSRVLYRRGADIDDGGLAATLARRLVVERRKREKVEEVASLQAEQILLLQRQANRTAILEELLADERHLSAALRADRQRVEDELMRALTALDAAAAAAAAASPTVAAADKAAPLPAVTPVDATGADGMDSAGATAWQIPSTHAAAGAAPQRGAFRDPDVQTGASIMDSYTCRSTSGLAGSAPSPLTLPLASAPAVSEALAVTTVTEAGCYSASDNGSMDTEAVAADEPLTPPRSRPSRRCSPPPPAGSMTPSGGDAGAALAEMATHLLVEKEAWVEERSRLRRAATAASAQVEAMAAQLKEERAAALIGEGPRLAALRDELAEKEQRAEYEAASAERLATEVERLNDFVLAKEAALASAAAELKRLERQLWEKDVESEQREVELRSLREASTIGETEKRLITDKASWTRERNELLRELAEGREKLAALAIPSVTPEQLRRLRGEAAVARAAVAALREERDALRHRLGAATAATGAASNGPEGLAVTAVAAGERGDLQGEGANPLLNHLQDGCLEAPTLAASAAVEGAREKERQEPPRSGDDTASEPEGHRTDLDGPPTVEAMTLDTCETNRSPSCDEWWARNSSSGHRQGRGSCAAAFVPLGASKEDIDLLEDYGEADERVAELLEQLEDVRHAALEGEEREQRVKDDADAAIRRLEALVTAPLTQLAATFTSASVALPPPFADAAGAAAASVGGAAALPAASAAALRAQLERVRVLADEREWEARRSERQAAEARRCGQRAAAAEAAAERRCRTLEREAAAQRRLTTTLRSRLAEAESTVTALGQRLQQQEALLQAERLRPPARTDELSAQPGGGSGGGAESSEAVVAELRKALGAREAELRDIAEVADAALSSEVMAMSAAAGARVPPMLARGGSVISRVLDLRAAWERRGFELQRNQDAATAATVGSTAAATAAAAELAGLKALADALRAELAAARQAAATAAATAARELAAAQDALQARLSATAAVEVKASAADRRISEVASAGLLRERDMALREQKRLLQAALEKAEAARATTAKAVAALASLEGVLDASATAGAATEPPEASDSDWGGEGASGKDAAEVDRRAWRVTRKALALASALRRRGDELARAHSEAAAQELCLDDTRRRLETALAAMAAAEAKARIAAEAEAEARAAATAAATAAAAAREGIASNTCGGGCSLGGTGPVPPGGRVSSNVLEQLRGEIEQVRRRNDGLRRELRGRSGSRAA